MHGYEHLRHPQSTREAVARDLDMALDALARDGVAPDAVADSVGASGGLHARRSRGRGSWRSSGGTRTRTTGAATTRGTMLDALAARRHGGIVLAHDGISVGARRETRAGDRRAGPAAGRDGARARTRTWPAARRLAHADPGRESELPSRGSAGGVTALAVRDVLDEIAANAAALDAQPAFPRAAFAALQRRRRAHAAAHPRRRNGSWCGTVSKADGSVGRIFEGHLNGYERLDARRDRPGGPPARRLGRRPGCPARASRPRTSRTTRSTARRCSAPARAGSTGRW